VRDELLQYYERELTFLRRMGADFARRYPKVAGRLQLEETKCEDPHVERLLEGFAFLAARVHLKLDADFPEVSAAMLDVLAPQYVRPIPSMSVVQLGLDPEQGKLSTGYPVPRGTPLFSRPVAGAPCRFRTCYDVTLWPLQVAAAQWTTPDRVRVRAPEAAAALRLELRCLPDVRLDALDLDVLRVHLAGESTLAHALYELLDNNVVRILAREPGPGGRTIELPRTALRPAGFGEDDGMFPGFSRAFVGYRGLLEYFTFPAKFFFFDLGGFDRLRAAGFGEAVELVFLVSPFERMERRETLEAGVRAEAFRLGCTPVVNLFPQTAEPIRLTQRQHEYLVVPDARRRASTFAYTVESVVGVTPSAAEPVKYEPFYSHRHGTAATRGTRGPVFWRAARRFPPGHDAEAPDVYLSFADLSGVPAFPEQDSATVRLTCFNGDLPSRLAFGGEASDFELDGGGPVNRVTALVKPTPAVRPPLGQPLLWRLISQLSLNHLSLVEDGGDALRELLLLHDLGRSAVGAQHVQGVAAVRSAASHARVTTEHGLAFARGRRVEVEFDEEQFVGGGAYLLAAVLERFLGAYASLNSFVQLDARSRQRRRGLRVWPPRSGWKTLV
jgi:type VI secretion system protein ImpG